MIKRPNEEKMKISEEFREGITADEQSTDTDGLISFKENHQGETVLQFQRDETSGNVNETCIGEIKDYMVSYNNGFYSITLNVLN